MVKLLWIRILNSVWQGKNCWLIWQDLLSASHWLQAINSSSTKATTASVDYITQATGQLHIQYYVHICNQFFVSGEKAEEKSKSTEIHS